MRSARAIMIQGTGSHVGKSLLVTALCRMLADEGVRVAPFKAQNMALNSCVTAEGGEIGRAQALQARAARIELSVDMNPILLKPNSETGSQVIVHGQVVGNMEVKEYHQYKSVAWQAVVESYERLAQAFEVIIIEGAGSPAEINLKSVDIVNMRVAALADAPVLLVGDIDRGGVFASLLGTMEWLEESERERVAGFLINKFRGEASLLGPGIEALRDRTGRGVWGVIPFIPDLRLEEEDGVALEAASAPNGGEEGQVVIGVVRFPRISNFTDVDPWRDEPSVVVRFVGRPEELEGVRVVLLPGTKNTIEDLQWFRRSGLAERVHAIARGGGHVVGICGGFQMLGRSIADPHHVETGSEPAEGLGLLPVSTTLEASKVLAQVQLEPDGDWVCSYHGLLGERRHALVCHGYEIHMGRSERIGPGRPAFRILARNRQAVQEEDGCINEDRRVWGSYAHGLFENDQFRRCLIAQWGGPSCLEGMTPSVSFAARRERELTRLAAIVKGHVDYRQIKRCLGF